MERKPRHIVCRVVSPVSQKVRPVAPMGRRRPRPPSAGRARPTRARPAWLRLAGSSRPGIMPLSSAHSQTASRPRWQRKGIFAGARRMAGAHYRLADSLRRKSPHHEARPRDSAQFDQPWLSWPQRLSRVITRCDTRRGGRQRRHGRQPAAAAAAAHGALSELSNHYPWLLCEADVCLRGRWEKSSSTTTFCVAESDIESCERMYYVHM